MFFEFACANFQLCERQDSAWLVQLRAFSELGALLRRDLKQSPSLQHLAAPCSSLQGFLSSATSASFAEMSAVSRTLQFSCTVSALVCKALFLNSYCFRILRRRLFEYLEQVVPECFARSARSHDTALKSTCAGLCWIVLAGWRFFWLWKNWWKGLADYVT